MSKQKQDDLLESLVSDLRADINTDTSAPVLDEPREGREISTPRRLSRRVVISIAITGVLLLLGAVLIVRQPLADAAVVDTTSSQFEVEGDWLTPGAQEPLTLPEQELPLPPPPPLPPLLPTPPIDASSPLP